MSIRDVGEVYCLDRYIDYLKIYLRKQYSPHILLLLALAVCSNGVMSYGNLTLQQSATVFEMYYLFIGIILFTPLFTAEQDEKIREVVLAKEMSYWKLCLIRFLFALTVLLVSTAMVLYVLIENGSRTNGLCMWWIACCEMLLVGGVGYMISAITNQVLIGYLCAILYYFGSIYGGNKLSVCNVAQMMAGNYHEWPYTLVIGAMLFTAGFYIRVRRK
ncbi:hypothetical protein lbkm_0469 [Lachnospiraceae bacterium KM106-2]|nr:hypothetical protein lbkm_0469 [Lachnospiraceae bacterium KM106-2]